MNAHKSMYARARAYSLVELIVVMAIMSILIVSAFTIFQIAYKRARDVPRIRFLKAVQMAIEAYRSNHHEFPTCDAGTDDTTLHVDDFDHACYIDNLGSIKAFFGHGYKSPLPHGNSTIHAMAYYLNANNNTYILCTALLYP